ncbi:MAG: NAD(P)/FAD-dependent oxidoreductase [Owenweeksia sp.]
MTHYQIIGQGIAGTVLSMQMMQRGIRHTIHDNPELSSSSRVAAGLVNPIVLKRLRLVHEASFFYNGLVDFYRHWEKELSASFFHEAPIRHIFQSQAEQNAWMAKSDNPAFKPFMGPVSLNNNSHIQASFGFGETRNTFWLDTAALLKIYRNFMYDQDLYREGNIDPIAHANEPHRIWCMGHLQRNSYLPDNIFSPTKGELLIIHSEELQSKDVWHAGVFILPLGNDLFKVGSTYAWDELDDFPTKAGRKKIEKEFRKIFSGNYSVVDHYAGVRPNIRDRKPIIGQWQGIHIFNGLGSRGVLLAPQLANLYLDFLIDGKSLPDAYDINRFT